MSNIDIVAFYNTNQAVILPDFELWKGNQFATSEVSESGIIPLDGGTQYIPPMQSFFVTVRGNRGINNTITFNVDDCAVTTTSPAPQLSPVSQKTLKSTPSVESDILRIRATNSEYTAETLVGKSSMASDGYVSSEDVYKMFSQKLNVPEVFTVADNYKLAMNFISGATEQYIPLGLKSDLTGATTFTFTGMAHFSADKIEFIDLTADRIIDLTGRDGFEYPFTHDVKGLEEGRFILRIQNALTDIHAPVQSTIQVYEAEGSIRISSTPSNLIRQVELYTVNGQCLYSNTALNNGSYTIANRWLEPIILVRVVSEQGVKNVKLINK
jgi:hypothetical protein